MIPAGLKVNGGRNTRFTGTFTVAFTLMANLTCVRRDGCGRNDGLLCTWPNHRTGREDPTFWRTIRSKVLQGRSRPHSNFGAAFCAVAYTDPRICQTECLTSCMKAKGEARCLY